MIEANDSDDEDNVNVQSIDENDAVQRALHGDQQALNNQKMRNKAEKFSVEQFEWFLRFLFEKGFYEEYAIVCTLDWSRIKNSRDHPM